MPVVQFNNLWSLVAIIGLGFSFFYFFYIEKLIAIYLICKSFMINMFAAQLHEIVVNAILDIYTLC